MLAFLLHLEWLGKSLIGNIDVILKQLVKVVCRIEISFIKAVEYLGVGIDGSI